MKHFFSIKFYLSIVFALSIFSENFAQITGKWVLKNIRAQKEMDEVSFTFQGKGFAWIGTNDRGLSAANIYIDGELVEKNFIFFSREKTPNSILYSKEGLKNGLHTVRIVAQKSPNRPTQGDKAVIPIGAIKVLNGKSAGNVLLIVNNELNYTEMGLENYI